MIFQLTYIPILSLFPIWPIRCRNFSEDWFRLSPFHISAVLIYPVNSNRASFYDLCRESMLKIDLAAHVLMIHHSGLLIWSFSIVSLLKSRWS